MAVAGLAFTCLERSHLNSDLRHRITLAIRTAQEKILKAQTPEGYFGNVYSTPLALQVGQRGSGSVAPLVAGGKRAHRALGDLASPC